MRALTTILTCLSLCACSSQAKNDDSAQNNTDKNENTMKTLVAYYSATGTTERVARTIADATGGTLYSITPAEEYTSADLDWRDSTSRSSLEMNDSTSRPQLGGKTIDASEYDVVFLGYPIWWDLCPRVVNTWIESQKLDGKKVIPFATSGGSTIRHSVSDLRKLYPGINWQDGKLLNGRLSEASEWAESMCE